MFAIPSPGREYGGVYNLGVMEHFEQTQIQDILSEIRRVLKPGGKLLIFWPHALATSVFVLNASHWLLNRVLKSIESIREERYSLFRGFFHGASDAADAAENLQPRLHSVVLPERAHAVGRKLAELPLAGAVEITAVRRRGMRPQKPPSDWRFDAGDAVVLLGRPSAIATAEQTLLDG